MCDLHCSKIDVYSAKRNFYCSLCICITCKYIVVIINKENIIANIIQINIHIIVYNYKYYTIANFLSVFYKTNKHINCLKVWCRNILFMIMFITL